MNNRGCIGRKMYSDSTLKSFTKEELIGLLHIAECNYQALSKTHDASVKHAELMIIERDKPKKPTDANISEKNSYCCWLCPTCGRTHINDSPLNFCSDCGQKINWDDYEKYLVDSEDDEEAEEDES